MSSQAFWYNMSPVGTIKHTLESQSTVNSHCCWDFFLPYLCPAGVSGYLSSTPYNNTFDGELWLLWEQREITKCVLWQPDGMNCNMTVAESDPDPRMSFHRDADVMAAVLQNANELHWCWRHVVSYLVEVSHPEHLREHCSKIKKNKKVQCAGRKTQERWREQERGRRETENVDMCELLVRKKPLSRS